MWASTSPTLPASASAPLPNLIPNQNPASAPHTTSPSPAAAKGVLVGGLSHLDRTSLASRGTSAQLGQGSGQPSHRGTHAISRCQATRTAGRSFGTSRLRLCPWRAGASDHVRRERWLGSAADTGVRARHRSGLGVRAGCPGAPHAQPFDVPDRAAALPAPGVETQRDLDPIYARLHTPPPSRSAVTKPQWRLRNRQGDDSVDSTRIGPWASPTRGPFLSEDRDHADAD